MWTYWAAAAAMAGSGPWVVGEGQGSVYVGGEVQRLTRLAITVDDDRQVIDVGEGLSSLGAKVIGTVGLTPKFEIQGVVPYWRVQANRPDAELCGALGLGACRTTSSLGVLEVRAKGLVLDELYGAPVSLALGSELRSGDLTAPTRQRITNVGEGGLDAAAFTSVGRSGALGQGYWSGFVELLGRYRFPLTRSYQGAAPGGGNLPARQAPGSEFGSNAELMFGAGRRFAIGPVGTALWRPWGLDWGEIDLTDRDRLGALKIVTVRAGGVVMVRGPRDVTASLAVLHTVTAQNNPTDVFSISAGIQTLLRRRGRTPDE